MNRDDMYIVDFYNNLKEQVRNGEFWFYTDLTHPLFLDEKTNTLYIIWDEEEQSCIPVVSDKYGFLGTPEDYIYFSCEFPDLEVE